MKQYFWNNQSSYISGAIGFSMARIIMGEFSYIVILVLLFIIYYLKTIKFEDGND